jgi:hypothetical protein
MAYTDYKLVRANVADIDAVIATMIDDDWQPLGNPVLGLPEDNVVCQIMVKGGPSAGVVEVADITDASVLGADILQAANVAAVKTLLEITDPSTFGAQLLAAQDAAAVKTLLGIS